jgi:flagellar FliJ protein
MQPVQRVAQSREQTAVRKLGQSQQHLAAQKARLEELRTYRDQYAKAFETSGGEGLSAARMRDYRLFLERLNEAIRQQEAIIAQGAAQHEQRREEWVKTRSHSQAVEKAVDRYRREEDRQQQKVEQKEQDEYGQRPTRK